MAYIKRDYKDSVFRHLFGSAERKSSALELYNALAGTQHANPGEIEITTIDNFLFLGRRNDVSFLIGDEMVLLEHQSTHNPNMPLRGLQYFERVYSKHIAVNELDIYGRQLVNLPPRASSCSTLALPADRSARSCGYPTRSTRGRATWR